MSPGDIIVVSIAVGIVVSFLFSEVYGIAAGGVVVPGYVALFLDRPIALAMTLGVALLSFGIARVAGALLIIYGRRRTALTILIGFTLGAWLSRVDLSMLSPALETDDGMVIGFIIPGLVAIWFDRQGVLPTVASLTIASVIVRLVLLLWVGPIVLHGAGF